VFPAWYGDPFNEYCKGGVPPDAVTVMVVVPPLHKIGGADADTIIAGGAGAIVIGVVDVHPFASFTVTV
jgi:hypothetical protein